MVDALRIVIEPQKVKADDLKFRQDNRAPIVGPFSITPWMMFSKVRWLKHRFFLMLDIAKLKSIQYQDADNRISNPTDLAAKLPSNLIFIMLDMVRKRWCTPTYPALQCETACYSDHADWFLTLVLTRLSRFSCEIGPICVCRAPLHVIRLHSMDFSIFASADRRQRRLRHLQQDTICDIIS